MLDDRTWSTRRLASHRRIHLDATTQPFWLELALGSSCRLENGPQGLGPRPRIEPSWTTPDVHRRRPVDLFVEEDIEFAKRLIEAGVSTELCVAPGAYHGFFFLSPDATVSKEFAASFNAALARGFERM